MENLKSQLEKSNKQYKPVSRFDSLNKSNEEMTKEFFINYLIKYYSEFQLEGFMKEVESYESEYKWLVSIDYEKEYNEFLDLVS